MKIIQYTGTAVEDMDLDVGYFIKFSTPVCPGCKLLTRTIETVESEFDALILDVDAQEYMDYARRYMVKSVPSLLFIKNEGLEQVKKYTGNPTDGQELAKFFKECLDV